MLFRSVSQSRYDAAGWARYCFSDPSKSKQALNAYVAHPPQSLNAMTLNKAFMDVFYKVALVEIQDFRLTAQIHDSILFQFREGREDLAQQVKQRMEIPVTVIGSTERKEHSQFQPLLRQDLTVREQLIGEILSE